ncbi:MAG: hypothetical protein R2856_28245 [Caldilineaceae bacterium]
MSTPSKGLVTAGSAYFAGAPDDRQRQPLSSAWTTTASIARLPTRDFGTSCTQDDQPFALLDGSRHRLGYRHLRRDFLGIQQHRHQRRNPTAMRAAAELELIDHPIS